MFLSEKTPTKRARFLTQLGEPTSPPNTRVPGKRWKYTRSFSSGTTVYVDVATRVVEIKWHSTAASAATGGATTGGGR
jgi:hypothetical protein